MCYRLAMIIQIRRMCVLSVSCLLRNYITSTRNVWCLCSDIHISLCEVLKLFSVTFSLTIYWHEKQPANTIISCLSHTINILPDFSWHKPPLSVWNWQLQQNSSIVVCHSQNCVHGCFVEPCFLDFYLKQLWK